MPPPVEAALRRQRALTIGALAILTLLAWVWLLLGAGMGMEPQAALHLFPATPSGDMTDMPGMDMPMAPAGWTAAQLLLAVSMWWVMMVAMMLPAAAPVILLYARAAAASSRPATGSFLAGYLGIWGVFSLLAALLQDALQRSGAMAAMTMDSTAVWLSAAILIVAGFYQIGPLKEEYRFESGRIYNIECSRVIANRSGLSGAHSDIAHPEIAHLLWEAAFRPS